MRNKKAKRLRRLAAALSEPNAPVVEYEFEKPYVFEKFVFTGQKKMTPDCVRALYQRFKHPTRTGA